jgi:hypothetical protein
MEANKSGAYRHLPTLFVINRKSTGLPSHGRGHWFDPSIAHTSGAPKFGAFIALQGQLGSAS